MAAPYTPPISTISITAGGTGQVLLAASERQSVIIQPQTEACVINWGGAQAGTQATGNYALAANPSNTNTLTFNGTAFTFVTGTSTATNIHIGADEATTLAEAATVLNASVTAGVALATYTSDATHIYVTFDAGGVTGNAYTLGTVTGGNVTRSSATLTGGSNTVGGIALALNQIGIFSAADFPAIKGDINVVSATTSAFIAVGASEA